MCCGCGPLCIAVHSGTADLSSSVLWLWAIIQSGTADRSSAVLWLWAIAHTGTADRIIVMYCGCGPLYIEVHSGTADRSIVMCCGCGPLYIAVVQIIVLLCAVVVGHCT